MSDKPLIWCDEIGSQFSRRLTKYALQGGCVLYLNSTGGDCTHMTAALDIILSGGWTTVGTGAIMSAAVPILAAGEKGYRHVTERCRLMVHLPRLWTMGASSSDELETEGGELRHIEQVYCDILGQCSRKPSSFWLKKLREKKDWYFDAKEAVRLGLADRVVLPK